MFNPLFPHTADNTYRGYKLGLWIFGFVVLWKLAIAAGCTFNGYNAASSADGIPLAAFGTLGAHAVVTEYAAWGVGQFALLAICIAALVRYRSLVPLLFLVVALEHVARKLVYIVLPIERVAGAAGGPINSIMLALIVLGFVMTLLTAKRPAAAQRA